jgi:superfamily II DNA or RNA helicase
MKPFSPGTLVHVRERDWVVQPSDSADLLVIRPLGGIEDERTSVWLPLALPHDQPSPTEFLHPTTADLGPFDTARLMHDAARLAFRSGAGPFRALAKLSFRPRSYQMVPLIMALRLPTVRLLVADDVGVGKTIEGLLIIREMLERRRIRRFAVVCLAHLCEQWQDEIREKLDLEAVVIRSNTQARLDREIQGDVSVFEHYPFQVLSVDYIKSEGRADVFIAQAPELVIVDEAHTCARPTGAAASQQQRYHLIHRLAQKPAQHLVLLTATPHSGKSEEFHSLLGLVRAEFETLDIPQSSQPQRRELARHFIQRRRADVARWLPDDEVPFAERDSKEAGYELSNRYAAFFDRVLDFARKLVAGDARKRGHYWAALGLLRGVMSSPDAGVEMLRGKLENLAPDALDEETGRDAVHDSDFTLDPDVTPVSVIESHAWDQTQRRILAELARDLAALAGPEHDRKLAGARELVEELLRAKFHVVVFCRYIATARYVGEQLRKLLGSKFPRLHVEVITSELADDDRRERVTGMLPHPQRLLVATDCLSEGINLQHLFTAVVHYDLPWNPNRLEQREGRVDRFGQTAPIVKTCLLYGTDNPIDGVVLDVILRKVREIRRSTGITVPFPEDSRNVIDTITQALLLNPDRQISVRRDKAQVEFDFAEFEEARKLKLTISDELQKAEAREKLSRSIFAQHAIKAHEIEGDLRDTDLAIGNPRAVETFVFASLNNLLGAEMRKTTLGYRLVTTNLPDVLKSSLRREGAIPDQLSVSFDSPTPDGHLYLGRNHAFVEALCQLLMSRSLARRDKRPARAAVIRCAEVTVKTTLLLLRARLVIAETRNEHQLIAEEMLVWGWRGSPSASNHLEPDDARHLLAEARPAADVSPYAAADALDHELAELRALRATLDAVAEARCQRLVEAHERYSRLLDEREFQVVHPVLPMDVLGVYVLLPVTP